MYKHVIFDLYGVLIDLKEEATNWEKLSQFMGYQGAVYTPEELKETYDKVCEKYLARYNSKNSDVVDVQDIFLKLYSNKKVKIKPKVLKQTVLVYRTLNTQSIGLYDDVRTMLENLAKNKKSVYLLADGQHSYIVGELLMLGINGLVKDFNTSSDHHMVMADAGAIKKLMEDHEMKKSETIYVGAHLKRDTKIAKSVGVDSLCVCTEEESGKAEGRATYLVNPSHRKKIGKIIIDGKA